MCFVFFSPTMSWAVQGHTTIKKMSFALNLLNLKVDKQSS